MKKYYRWNIPLINERILELQSLAHKDFLTEKEYLAIVCSLQDYLEILELLAKFKKHEKRKKEGTPKISAKQLEIFYNEMAVEYEIYLQYNCDKTKDLLTKVSQLMLIQNEPLKSLINNDGMVVNDVRNFFKASDSFLYDELKKIEQVNPDIFHFIENLDSYGFCYFDFYNHIPYIAVEKTNSLVERYTLVHEIGHAIDYINNPVFDVKNEIYSETIPYLLEMLLTGYYHENNLYSGHIEAVIIENCNDRIIDAKHFVDQTTLFEAMNRKPNFDADDLYSLFPGESDNIIETILIVNRCGSLKYIYSYLLAVELFYQYEADPISTLKNIRKLIKEKSFYEPKDLYASVGIDCNSLSVDKFDEYHIKMLSK